MKCKSTVVWWQEDGLGKWSTTQCESAKELPELVASFKVRSISQTDTGDMVTLILTLNNYTERNISMPSIVRGIQQKGIKLRTISARSDPESIVNAQWKRGKYLFTKPLPEKSNVSLELIIEITSEADINNTTINVIEKCMDENSPTLFEEISIETPMRATFQLNNSLLFAKHGERVN